MGGAQRSRRMRVVALAAAFGALVAVAPTAAAQSVDDAPTTTATVPTPTTVAPSSTTTVAPSTTESPTTVPPTTVPPTTVPATTVPPTNEATTADVAPMSISAHADVAAIRVGWSTYVRGHIVPPGVTPFVYVQRLVSGRWSDRARSGPPAADGSFRVQITPSQVATYTLRVRSAGGTLVSPSFTLVAVPPPTISANLTTTAVVLGAPVRINGTVTPAGATPVVVSQRLVGGRWVDRDAAPVNPTTGNYSITIRPSQAAAYVMRVRSRGGTVRSGTVGLSTYYVAYTMVDSGDARPGERVVSLTFDDGPNATYTPRLLDVLAKYGVKATFSVVGYEAAAQPELLARMVREGHHLANHSWNHPAFTTLADGSITAQVRSTDELISAAGYRGRCVRPPYGSRNSRTDAVIGAYRANATLLWNVDPGDYRNPGTSTIVARVMGALRPGAIIGMHDGGGNRAQTIAAVDQLIPLIQAAGYQIRPVC